MKHAEFSLFSDAIVLRLKSENYTFEFAVFFFDNWSHLLYSSLPGTHSVKQYFAFVVNKLTIWRCFSCSLHGHNRPLSWFLFLGPFAEFPLASVCLLQIGFFNEHINKKISEPFLFRFFFQRSSNPEFKELYRGIIDFNKSDSEVLSANVEVHKRKILTEKYAFIGSSSNMESFIAEHCDVIFVDQFAELPYAFPLPKGSIFTPFISKW